jgi:hypothetical protein
MNTKRAMSSNERQGSTWLAWIIVAIIYVILECFTGFNRAIKSCSKRNGSNW